MNGLLILLAAFTLAAGKSIDSRFDSRIVNGQDADTDEWPWQLALERKVVGDTYSFSCGSTLIDGDLVLTAAHCVDGSDPTRLRFYGGTNQQNAFNGGLPAQFRDGKAIHVHPGWNPAYDDGNGVAHVNDIAVVELEAPFITNEHLAIAKLDNRPTGPDVGDVCTITGWGRLTGGGSLPNDLQEANDTVYDPQECETMLRQASIDVQEEYPNNVQGPGQVCIYNGISGSCNGDSGGPMNCFFNGEFHVSGVTSYGIVGCPVDYPSVYTRVSYYCEWVAQVMGRPNLCP